MKIEIKKILMMNEIHFKLNKFQVKSNNKK